MEPEAIQDPNIEVDYVVFGEYILWSGFCLIRFLLEMISQIKLQHVYVTRFQKTLILNTF